MGFWSPPLLGAIFRRGPTKLNQFSQPSLVCSTVSNAVLTKYPLWSVVVYQVGLDIALFLTITVYKGKATWKLRYFNWFYICFIIF